MARFAASAPSGQLLQSIEPLIRTAVFKPANQVVGVLLQQAIDAFDKRYQPKPGYRYKGRAELDVQCLFGWHRVQRDYYYNADRKEGYCPADSALGLENGSTPWLTRMMCREGASAGGFREAAKNLAETGGVKVSARQIQRMVQKIGVSAQAWQQREGVPGQSDASVLYVSADGTGVPALPSETKDRQGKTHDGKAQTRQAYLGGVFTQHERDEQGRPVRDPDSTTYVSSLASIHEFGPQLRQEAIRRGLATVPQTVLLIDGASGLENMGLSCFPKAIQVVDFFHAMEHAGEVLAALHGPLPADSPEHKKRLRFWAKDLLKNRVGSLIASARAQAAGTAAQEAVEKALGYFENNLDRMQYKTFRDQGFFIGSGVVEAGCKSVIGGRCKQSGMRWTVRGAENILAFRCIQSSRHLDEFWKHHLNLRAAENDHLQLCA
jgi:hypothetical protein